MPLCLFISSESLCSVGWSFTGGMQMLKFCLGECETGKETNDKES